MVPLSWSKLKLNKEETKMWFLLDKMHNLEDVGERILRNEPPFFFLLLYIHKTDQGLIHF